MKEPVWNYDRGARDFKCRVVGKDKRDIYVKYWWVVKCREKKCCVFESERKLAIV